MLWAANLAVGDMSSIVSRCKAAGASGCRYLIGARIYAFAAVASRWRITTTIERFRLSGKCRRTGHFAGWAEVLM